MGNKDTNQTRMCPAPEPRPIHDRMMKNGGLKPQRVMNVNTGEIYERVTDAANAVGGTPAGIILACKRGCRHRGFYFRRAD
jgi:hypothetical protein